MMASRGSIGGSAGETGVGYKRGVVAYIVAHGVSGASLSFERIPDSGRIVSLVATEVDDPVDDVRVDFADGRTAYFQAKSRIDAGDPLRKSVAQWVAAAQEGLDPRTQRLVLVASDFSGTIRTLGRLFDRRRADHTGDLTDAERKAEKTLNDLLSDLTPAQRDTVWECAVVWQLDVEEPASSGARSAIEQLRHVVEDHSPAHAESAWRALLQGAGLAARLRVGFTVDGWTTILRQSVPLVPDDTTPLAHEVARQEALDAYTERIVRDGTVVDLRALGAGLPPLPLDDIQATVEVGTDPDDARLKGELLWAFLRRHRVLLSGLPGGGKSTAIRRLAADLARDSTMPLPVVASLRGVRVRDTDASVADQILYRSVKHLSVKHRAVMLAEINDRLDNGRPVALLLDALDETYEQRDDVVAALDSWIASLPAGVAILLSTRRVALESAETLGWHQLQLLPPESINKTVTGILTCAATGRADAVRWVEEREKWVAEVLAGDPALRDTPLLPTFLTLLAIRSSIDRLPATRGSILVAVVKDFVLRHELIKRDSSNSESRDRIVDLGVRAYAIEANAIVESQGTATAAIIIDTVAADIADYWGYCEGPSRDAARKVLRALDEAGVFMYADEASPVIPQIPLLSEVGAAIFAMTNSSTLDSWLVERIAADQLEPVTLACSLMKQALELCESELAAHPTNYALAAALAQAHIDRAKFTDIQLRLVASSLIDHVSTATSAGWRSWHLLTRLPVPSDLVDALLDSIDELPVEHQTVIRSDSRISLGYSGHPEDRMEDFRNALALSALPVLGTEATRTDSFTELFSWQRAGLLEPQLRAAQAMVEQDPATAQEVADRALSGRVNHSLLTGLQAVLTEHGFDEEVARIGRALTPRFASLLENTTFDFDETEVPEFYAALSRWKDHAALSPTQQTSTSELAILINSTQASSLRAAESDDYREKTLAFLNYSALALGLDRSVIAAEAAVVHTRSSTWDTNAPFYALHQEVEPRRTADWSRIDDARAATSVFVRSLFRALPEAHFAAYVLSRGPESEVCGPLRAVIPKLRTSPRHQQKAAQALITASTEPLVNDWVSDDNPVLREVAAESAGISLQQLQDLLDDADGNVRLAALQRIEKSFPDVFPRAAHDMSTKKPTRWLCHSCATVNSRYSGSCSSEKCYNAAPDPDAYACRALASRAA